MNQIMNISTDPEIKIPSEMGVPSEGQFIGTWRERLVELAGRVCYDSLGKGRSSVEWHPHLHEVEHYSVHEHVTFVARLTDLSFPIYRVLANRPGFFVSQDTEGYRITFNPRCVNDWDKHCYGPQDHYDALLINKLGHMMYEVAPMLCKPDLLMSDSMEHMTRGKNKMYLVEPEGEEEIHVTCFMSGSRGFSHEQVRHRHRTAISQRSTRYVNEADSDWDWHPLFLKYVEDTEDEDLEDMAHLCQEECEELYRRVVSSLQPWMVKQGADSQAARKQARGAARGFLGNALNTEMLFTAPVSMWRWMYVMRYSHFADAEIRQVFGELLPDFQARGLLTDLGIKNAPDGIGTCLV